MQLQDNLIVEGKIQTNQTVDALNTTIFEDVGSGNDIKINIKGNINLNQKNLIKDYSQLLNIPIRIKKKGDLDPSSVLKISVGDLAPTICVREMNGLTDNMDGILLVEGDIITATYNGTNFIVNGDKFLNGIYVAKINDVITGTYTKVTINEQGQVIDGSNPTTLAGYGITDAAMQGKVDDDLNEITSQLDKITNVELPKKANEQSVSDRLANKAPAHIYRDNEVSRIVPHVTAIDIGVPVEIYRYRMDRWSFSVIIMVSERYSGLYLYSLNARAATMGRSELLGSVTPNFEVSFAVENANSATDYEVVVYAVPTSGAVVVGASAVAINRFHG